MAQSSASVVAPASPTVPTVPLPPPPPPTSTLSLDETISSLNRHPLFMTTLDETDGQGGSNVELEALRALAYEGDPIEVATNFHRYGNEAFKGRNWIDAREFYTRALKVLDDDDDGNGDRGGGDESEREVERVGKQGDGDEEKRRLKEVLLVNRAAANVELQNYRQVINDCTLALTLSSSSSSSSSSSPSPSSSSSSTNLKAHYRLLTAYLRLSASQPTYLNHAQTALTCALTQHAAHPSLVQLQKQLDQLLLKQQRSLASTAAKTHEALTLQRAFKQRNIRLVSSNNNNNKDNTPDLQDAAAHLADGDDPNSTLYVPVLVLYPLLARTDLIKRVDADAGVLAEELRVLFPLPRGPTVEGDGQEEREEEGYAGVDEVEFYMETLMGGMVRMGKKVRLIEVLGGGKVGVVDGLVRVFVVPKEKREEWLVEVRRRRKGGR